MTYDFILASFSFLNSWKVSFRVSIGGNAETKRSPVNRIRSTCSYMDWSIASVKYSRFSCCNSGCLQPPR